MKLPSLHRLRTLSRRARGLPIYGVELVRDSVLLGSAYGGYRVIPELIPSGAVAYSLGVGEDVSFDVALMARFKVELHAFDPTPRAAKFVLAQSLPPEFHFHAVGVAQADGTAEFAPPENPEHVSHSLLARRTHAESIVVPVKRLRTLMRELGHSRIDLLKMDIEGAEYTVLDDLVADGIAPQQILVEYHHHMPGIAIERTEASLAALRKVGYQVFAVSKTGHEFSLALAP